MIIINLKLAFIILTKKGKNIIIQNGFENDKYISFNNYKIDPCHNISLFFAPLII